jgi:rRNA-processing protein FCF1
VVDTNTIIDLWYGDILEKVFQLPCTFIIPDFIAHELRNPPFQSLSTMGLVVETLDSEMIPEITQIMERLEKLSYEDISALILARSRRTILITGDQDLRHAAMEYGVDSYGTCWLIDYLANQSIITYKEAISAYVRIRNNRRNPPFDECKSLLSQWRQRQKLLE